jgi:hypothetical protein
MLFVPVAARMRPDDQHGGKPDLYNAEPSPLPCYRTVDILGIALVYMDNLAFSIGDALNYSVTGDGASSCHRNSEACAALGNGWAGALICWYSYRRNGMAETDDNGCGRVVTRTGIALIMWQMGVEREGAVACSFCRRAHLHCCRAYGAR